MNVSRASLAAGFAQQILETSRPFLSLPEKQLVVLDVGCGFGFTTIELAKRVPQVTGIEPSQVLADHAMSLQRACGLNNVEFRRISVADLADSERYDLALLDNVLEHVPEQVVAMQRISCSLKPGGVLFVIVPNKFWPIEVHYRLPFLSYLPLPVANLYLRLSGRGTDYRDDSYAPSYWDIRHLFEHFTEFSYEFVIPANISLASMGNTFRYRLGVAAIRRCPWLWAISKAFLIIAVKNGRGNRSVAFSRVGST